MHCSCNRLGQKAEMRRGSGAADDAVILAAALAAFMKGAPVPMETTVASTMEGGVLCENQPAMMESRNNSIKIAG